MKVADDPTISRCIYRRYDTKGSSLQSFKYLGARFNATATCEEEIKTRLGLARDRMAGLSSV